MRVVHGTLEGPEFGMYQRGTLKSNLTMEEVRSAVEMICAFVDRNTYALFYYNGHALGHGNDVYLVSRDTDFKVTSLYNKNV